MSNYLIQGETLTGIADAIREKTGSTDQLSPSAMASAIAGIQAGGGEAEDMLRGLIERTATEIVVPDGTAKIGKHAFSYCTSIVSVSLPESITIIDQYAFQSCNALLAIRIPEAVVNINNWAFSYCGNLGEITFDGVPTDIGSYSFDGCAKLYTINVPWAEGAVANAPWGARNATINYNYGG